MVAKEMYPKAYLTIFSWVPASFLSRGALNYDVVQVGRVCLDGEMVGAQVALHAELVDGCGVVHPNLKINISR